MIASFAHVQILRRTTHTTIQWQGEMKLMASIKVLKSFFCPNVILFMLALNITTPALSAAAPEVSDRLESKEVEAIYASKCGSCHDKPIANAPHRLQFTMLSAQNVYKAMRSGVMKEQAASLSDHELQALAEHLSQGELTSTESAHQLFQCADAPSRADANLNTASAPKSWGFDLHNSRWVKDGLSRDEIARLKVKWVFAYPEATRARSQPTIYNGTVYVGSQNGTVYALDLQTGCVQWTYKARAEVRTAVIISDDVDPILYFGDFDGHVYSLSAKSGEENWSIKLPDHEQVTITGTPTLHNEMLYVPLSSREWLTAADPGYQCCSFRGGVVALNTKDGSRKWVSYTLDEAKPTKQKSPTGLEILAPSGAAVWHTPVIDQKRNRLYIGTGQNYSSPSSDTSDAIIAIDLDTGERLWHHQAKSGDAWNMACFLGGSENCPKENGPDYDFGAPPILITREGQEDLILAGQKSGDVIALSADNGKLRWRKKISLGGLIGGIHWGMTANKTTLFVPISDWPNSGKNNEGRKPGLYSLNIDNGDINWFTAVTNRCEQSSRIGCDIAVSAPATGTDEAIFAGSLDGYLYAFDSDNGEIIWEYSTNDQFESVSGRTAQGGAIEADGPVLFNKHLLVNSGYSFAGHLPGNALIVFSVDGL